MTIFVNHPHTSDINIIQQNKRCAGVHLFYVSVGGGHFPEYKRYATTMARVQISTDHAVLAEVTPGGLIWGGYIQKSTVHITVICGASLS